MLGTPDTSAFRLRRVRSIGGVARSATPGTPASAPGLLLEDGGDLLLEDGDNLLLEE